MDTEKAKQAGREGNVWILRPSWLFVSVWRWSKAEEKDYAWDPTSQPKLKHEYEHEHEHEHEHESEPPPLLQSDALLDEDAYLLAHLDDEDSESQSPNEHINLKKRKQSAPTTRSDSSTGSDSYSGLESGNEDESESATEIEDLEFDDHLLAQDIESTLSNEPLENKTVPAELNSADSAHPAP